MDLKVYRKTRYQNIYQHIKNKNYVVEMSKPVKTSISRVDGNKIFKIEDAIKVRDNPKIKAQKGLEVKYKEDFDTLWEKYTFYCKYEKKIEYNTLKRKSKIYNKYFKEHFKNKVSKIQKEELIRFLNKIDTTEKQKNEVIKELKAFFNWCILEEYLIVSPAQGITKYKTEKVEMKFWTPEEIKQILSVLDEDINSSKLVISKKAQMIKLFILINFSLGDRVGETRALTYNCFDKKLGTVKIKHSINYDTSSDNFFTNTKTYHSQREVDITSKLIDEVEKYKHFLIYVMNYDVKDSDMIFFNYSTNRPYSDVTIRKKFYYYCDKAQVTKIRMYDLRHTYVATMMGEGKELYHISSRIGHSSYSTTVNKYGHLSIKKRKEIAEITDKYI